MSIDSVECVMCHAVHSESFAGNPGRSWRCTRCGQRWDDARIAVVIDYQRWLKTGAASGNGGVA